MKLKHFDFLKTLLLICCGVLFYWLLEHYNLVLSAFGWGCRVLWPLFLGFCIAFVLNIPMRFFERHLFKNPRFAKIRRPVCIFLSLFLILALLVMIFGLVIPELSRAVLVLGRAIPEFASSAQEWALQQADPIPVIEEWLQSLEVDWNESVKNLAAQLTHGVGNFVGNTVSLVSSIIGSIFNFVVAFIFALYILLGKETLKKQSAQMLRAIFPAKLSDKLFFVVALSRQTFSNFICGQCFEACILGVLCWLGMTILRLPYAPMIGALVGISALVPIVGAWIGGVVGAFIIGMENITLAIVFVVFLLVLQQVEGNLIYPKVVGSSVGLPSIWVLACITVGGTLSGIAGMMFAVPVCSILYSLVRLWTQSRLEQKDCL